MILEAIRQGRIEYTKAKEIAKLESEPEQLALLEEAIANSLTLRQVKKLVGEKKAPKKVGEMQAEIEDVFKKAKKFAAWDNPEKCDKLKSLLAELKLVLAEGNWGDFPLGEHFPIEKPGLFKKPGFSIGRQFFFGTPWQLLPYLL